MGRTYLCIDLKSFYASVECVERGLDPFKVSLVVADPTRGGGTICLAITPYMKSLGVRNRCRCYEIPKNIKYIVAKPRMKKYIEYSAKIYSIYLKYISKDDIHIYSVDECFLDVTSYLNLYKMDAYTFAKFLMSEIYKETGITATCGIGTNMYLTKVALDILSKHNKSNIGYLDEELFNKEMAYHEPLSDFWGIGIHIEDHLHKLHIKNMHDLSMTKESLLYKEFGINAKILIDHAKGIETTTIKDIKKYKPRSKSISNSQILFRDYSKEDARVVLSEMVNDIVLKLVNMNLYTGVVSFYVGYSKDIIRPTSISFKLKKLTASYTTILSNILNEYDYVVSDRFPIRKLGISLNNLNKKEYDQIDLFNEYLKEEKEVELEKSLNYIVSKYGKNSILRGISYGESANQRMRNKLVGGHNAE